MVLTALCCGGASKAGRREIRKDRPYMVDAKAVQDDNPFTKLADPGHRGQEAKKEKWKKITKKITEACICQKLFVLL